MPRLARKLIRVATVTTPAICAVTIALFVTTPSVGTLVRENPERTAFMEAAAREGRRAPPLTWVPLAKIPPVVACAVVISEDGEFWRHRGIAWRSSWNALRRSLRTGRPSGASTITQQLARNLFLNPDRSLLRKLREAALAYALERSLTKERMIELYLNTIEWGDGIWGIEAAAQHYFGKSPPALDAWEGTLLAARIAAPRSGLTGRELRRFAQVQRRVLDDLYDGGLLDESEWIDIRRHADHFPRAISAGMPFARAARETSGDVFAHLWAPFRSPIDRPSDLFAAHCGRENAEAVHDASASPLPARSTEPVQPRLASALDPAARSGGVPRDVLAAVAYAESRFVVPTFANGIDGWVRLFERTRGPRSLLRAAAQTGATPEAVRADPVLGLEAVARVLGAGGRRAGLTPESNLSAWLGVVRGFNGSNDSIVNALYVDNIARILQAGVRAADGMGWEVAIDPHPTVGMSPARVPSFIRASTATWRVSTVPRRITHIVIHAMEGSFAGTIGYVRQRGTRVSAHYAIRSLDGLTVRLVRERDVAYHDACFNENSIGIEHEGFSASGQQWFSGAMYEASARLVREIADRYGIPLDRQHILGHGETPDCSEHTDPGPSWDWARYMALVRTRR